MWGKTNTNKSITDGTANPSNVLSGYTFYAGNNTIQTGTLVPTPPLGSIFIQSGDFDVNFGGANTYSSSAISTTYCVNISNYIYCPVLLYALGAGGFQLFVQYFTTDSSAFPTRVTTTYGGTYAGYSITSQYVNSGIIYFNDSGGKYHTFNTSTHAFTTNNSGSHTTGTHITAPLQLNGYQYDIFGAMQNWSGQIWGYVKTKVTKL